MQIGMWAGAHCQKKKARARQSQKRGWEELWVTHLLSHPEWSVVIIIRQPP